MKCHTKQPDKIKQQEQKDNSRKMFVAYMLAQPEQRGQGNVQESISLCKPQPDVQQEHL